MNKMLCDISFKEIFYFALDVDATMGVVTKTGRH